jgi:MATE family multidrug resistance protein
MGPAGAGVASFLVASATLGVLVAIHRTLARSPLPGRAAPSWAEVAAVLRVGLPIGFATVGEVGIFLAVTLYAGRLGAADVAAHTLALRTAGVAYAVPAALLQASLVRMARAEGDGLGASGRAVIGSSLALALGAGLLLCLAIALGAAPMATFLFDATAAGVSAATLATALLLLLAVMELVGAPGAAAAGLLRGRKEARAPMMYSLLGHWAFGAPVGLFLCEVHDLGIVGLWVGLLAGTAASGVLSVIRLLVPPASVKAA